MAEQNDLTRGSILGKLFRFFFPVLFGTLFQQLYNAVDAVVVGRCVGAEALAAVGGSPAVIINLVIGFFMGLASGATVIIAQYFGSGDEERLSRAEHTVLSFCLLAGLVMTLGGWLSADWTLRLVNTPADILEASGRYLKIFYLGTVPLLLFNVGSGILRAVGDSRWPLVFLGACCGLNIVLDLLFVAVFRMGVEGAAWATVLSLTGSAAAILVHLARLKNACRLRLSALGIHWPSLRKILYIGVPTGIQSALYSVSNVVIQSTINGFGTTLVAAWTALGKLDGIFWSTSNSFGVAICTFVGQCFGAGEYERMKKGIRQWLMTAIGVALSMTVLLLSVAKWGFRLFTDDQAVIQQAVTMMWYFSPFYFVWAFIDVISNALRGAGDSFVPMLICLIGVCLLRILWILLVVPHWHTVLGVSMSYPVTWFVTAVVFIVYYARGKWLDHCIRRS